MAKAKKKAVVKKKKDAKLAKKKEELIDEVMYLAIEYRKWIASLPQEYRDSLEAIKYKPMPKSKTQALPQKPTKK